MLAGLEKTIIGQSVRARFLWHVCAHSHPGLFSPQFKNTTIRWACPRTDAVKMKFNPCAATWIAAAFFVFAALDGQPTASAANITLTAPPMATTASLSGLTTSETLSATTAAASCKPGTKLGQTIVTQPNISSIVMIGGGAPFLVQWTYTALATRRPQTVDIKINTAAGDQKFQRVLVSGLDVSGGETAWRWNVEALADDAYKLRVVPDGKETLGKQQSDYPCFQDGDALPGTSGEFNVATDRFPPKASAAAVVSKGVVRWVSRLILAFCWCWSRLIIFR
ncbi:hypothetical protein DFJ73DRAFT_855861 [Zopfochytrium polystomum]|nr:hypothetical protein DFJ73DRAFT_855861 [Zopfochytrium polystomum]